MPIDAFENPSSMLASGIYLLLWRREVVYVGKSRQLYARMYSHKNLFEQYRRTGRIRLGRDGTPMKVIKFDSWRCLACHESDMDRLERQYIAEFRPKYNERLWPDRPQRTLTEAGFDWTKLTKGAPRARVECDRRV